VRDPKSEISLKEMVLRLETALGPFYNQTAFTTHMYIAKVENLEVIAILLTKRMLSA
jgi:hypothetical protein